MQKAFVTSLIEIYEVHAACQQATGSLQKVLFISENDHSPFIALNALFVAC